jgi:Protein of unknown function (DUF3768)
MTPGIAALGAEAVARIVKTVEVHDDFCHANDPYEEHDFGSFEIEGHTIFFKIAYYKSLKGTLKPGLYSAFHWLRNRSPIFHLAKSPESLQSNANGLRSMVNSSSSTYPNK